MGVSGGEAPAPHYKSAVAEIANREPTRAKNTIKAPERSLKKRRRRVDGRQRSQKSRSKTGASGCRHIARSICMVNVLSRKAALIFEVKI